jgi:flagellar biosynthetic protein FlhB
MAENDAERTEQPTQKRIDEARKKGQVPRSVELNTATVVLIAGAALHLLGGHLTRGMSELMRGGLAFPRELALDESLAVAAFSNSMMHALLTIAPLLGLTVLAALAAPMLIGGWNLSFGVLAPDFTRLSPMKGFSRIFSTRGLVELTKAFLKFLLVAAIAVAFLWSHTDDLLALNAQPVEHAIGNAVTLSGQAFLYLAGALAIIAAIDVPYQLWQHSQQLKMTRHEIREEMKESEGSPEIKGRIRQVQEAMARRRMMQEVPKADVIVTNPTHFAVALKYDDKRMRAPIVVAKGADEIAAKIREVAGEHLVPIFEAPPLARALYRGVAIGGEVPASLYTAVAQVLTYVYHVRAAQRSGTTPPPPPTIESPEDPPADPATRH